MKTPLRDRIAFALERLIWLHPVLLRPAGVSPSGRRRYLNRINGHVVIKAAVHPTRSEESPDE